jgi:hypothetical protein
LPISHQERDNLLRWDLKKRGFYEVYYLKWNDLSQGIAGWLRYTLLIPQDRTREPEVSVWAIFFDAKDPQKNCAVKKTFSIREARIEKEIFYLSAGPSAIFETGARGEIGDEKTQMSWELKFEGEGLWLKHFPSPLYWGRFPKTKFLAPYLSVKVNGEFAVNGRRFVLRRAPAHQAHLWGTEMAPFWIWGNCNTFAEDPDFCFEGLSARIGVGGKISPPLTLLFFFWRNKLYRFNSPAQWFTNRSVYDFDQRQRRVEGEAPRALPVEGATRAPVIDRWRFEASSHDVRFVGELFTETDAMAGVRYEDPDGSERFCHNTKVADLKIHILQKENGGWKTEETVTASKSAAFEVVQPTLDRRVKLLIP